LVCSVNLWLLSGNNKEPKKQEANETNKEEAKKGNARDGAYDALTRVEKNHSGYDVLISHLTEVK
jgi:hypothetical protein